MADISTDFWQWSSTAANNSPSGGTAVGTGLDDNLRALQAATKAVIEPLSSVAGTNTITASSANITAYTSGQRFLFVPANTNNGATTLNISSLGAKNVFVANAACVGGELVASVPVEVYYDGTQFQVVGSGGVAYVSSTQTLTNKTLTTPTIASFTNAQHNHSNAAGGGQIAASSLSGTISQSQIASSAVGQSQLKTAVNTTQTVASAVTDQAINLSGGRFCFIPTITVQGGAGSSGNAAYRADAVVKVSGGSDTLPNAPQYSSVTTANAFSATSSTEYTLAVWSVTGGGGSNTATLRVQYVQASPPYEPFGLGEHDLFAYVMVNRTTGAPEVVWAAEDPPWFHCGRTERLNRMYRGIVTPIQNPFRNGGKPSLAEINDYHAALEEAIKNPVPLSKMPQSVKNEDMDLIPHPLSHDPATHQMVLLAGPVLRRLLHHHQLSDGGIGELFLGGHIKIDNTTIAGATRSPRGVLLAKAQFKLDGR